VPNQSLQRKPQKETGTAELNIIRQKYKQNHQNIREIKMSTDLIQAGQAQAHYNSAGTRILKYSKEMYHTGLNEHKVVSAPEPDILQNKAELQATKWTEKWETIVAKQKAQQEKEANIEEAEARSNDAQEALEKVENILLHTLSINDTVGEN
jgi:hypothetical protein